MKNALRLLACISLLLGPAEAQNTTTNWTHIRNTPTTVAGYGIGDVWTRTQADARYAPIVVPYANLATLPGGTLLGNAAAGAAAPAAITIGSGLSLSVGGVLSATGGGGGGTVTTVVCGTGLTGGTITTTGTCAASFGTTAGTIAQGNDARIGAINGVTVSGTPVAGYVPTATSASTATWQAPSGGGGGAVSSFNSRVGAVVPAAGDYPPYLGGVGHRAGRRAWIGDSITARNNKTTPSINERSASGYAIWLNAGTVTVSNTLVTSSSRIFLTPQSLGTVSVPSACGISARSAGTSFTILCSQATDTSVIAWQIVEPAP